MRGALHLILFTLSACGFYTLILLVTKSSSMAHENRSEFISAGNYLLPLIIVTLFIILGKFEDMLSFKATFIGVIAHVLLTFGYIMMLMS